MSANPNSPFIEDTLGRVSKISNQSSLKEQAVRKKDVQTERITHTKAWRQEQTQPFGILLNSFYYRSSSCPWKVAKGEAGKASRDMEEEGAFMPIFIYANSFDSHFKWLLVVRGDLCISCISAALQITYVACPAFESTCFCHHGLELGMFSESFKLGRDMIRFSSYYDNSDRAGGGEGSIDMSSCKAIMEGRVRRDDRWTQGNGSRNRKKCISGRFLSLLDTLSGE